MLLLYRIYTILSSIYGIVHFPEYDGLHKYQTYGTFQTTQPPVFSPSSLYSSARKLTIGAYIPPAKSWQPSLILHQQKNEGYTLYIYPAVQSRISSAQKQANAHPNRNTTSHTIGSSLGAIRSTQPPANALVSAPNAHRIFTITGYLQQ